jgi:hypothetical protein
VIRVSWHESEAVAVLEPASQKCCAPDIDSKATHDPEADSGTGTEAWSQHESEGKADFEKYGGHRCLGGGG